MPNPVQSSREVAATTSNAAKKLFSGGAKEGRCGVIVYNRDTSIALRVRIVPTGAAAPAITDGQETYVVYPQSTYNLSPQGAWNHDVYVWGDGGAVINYSAEELV